MSDWKPGDVAMVTTTCCGSGVCVRRGSDSWVGGNGTHTDGFPVEARPLVVIDPESAEDVKRLRDLLLGYADIDLADVRAALREFAAPTPPRPDEPQGLGAVVEDVDGKRWVRTNQPKYPWSDVPVPDEDGGETWESCLYADIKAVRVLSEGVTP